MSLSDREFIRFNRHIMVEQIGEQGQLSFKQARVVVVGMGGLGCPAAQYLATAGVGRLTIVDNDTIELSNLQRQILYSDFDIGESKVEVAMQQLESLNPHCHVKPICDSILNLDTASLFRSADVVVDCTDNAEARQYINRACVTSGVKLVSAAAIQGTGQLSSFDFSQPSSPCYQCLYPQLTNEQLNCANMGVIGPLLGVMGSLQALEVLRLLLGRNDNIGKLLLFDGLDMQFQQFSVIKRADCPVCGAL
ncbi:molybdopterin-synthase adenylyltransferase MoeB [Thalassotalea ponticola]|uniref:HesA/MoeB/ThiF family protein n=1 Tax=Thalassotalea ponticola TaxID=1523392 RepID=UPI0025B510A0|nr:molybdopterin-synthase adenylyltransferase MoeB [Thalassotalea ponticola]MDN3652958.1 molybdopterin-synthase adenylyltransferase MoeB [Thalassotalea ponticola]